MSVGVGSPSSELDGWEDELDQYYDIVAKSERYEKVVNAIAVEDVSFEENAVSYYLSVAKTRGYDPVPPDYRDLRWRRIRIRGEEGFGSVYDEIFMRILEEGAEHALLRYNYQKSKDLKFVQVVKAFYNNTLQPAHNLFNITFEAEEGNQATRKFFQTRVLYDLHFNVSRLCSLRPKP